MKTIHKILYQDSRNLESIPSESIDLIVTSPPYPMIEMWDEMFGNQNPDILKALSCGEGLLAFNLMHELLNSVWNEVFRVLKNGRFACINIGDATRTVKDTFCLYPNHARILNYLLEIGFSALPDILWRKQANTPNKFMGSGMLPAGAYVTLEHEYILILRKGQKREFKTENEKENRRESALFWEERNIWYSDVWTDIKGKEQKLSDGMSRLRSGAFPFELAYRLINMYSVKGDVILDPFLGTGTTVIAAMTSARNSVGVEIDNSFQHYFDSFMSHIVEFSNEYLLNRLQKHLVFLKRRNKESKPMKYNNKHYGFPIVTSQEQSILFNNLEEIHSPENNAFEVMYSNVPQSIKPSSYDSKQFLSETIEVKIITYEKKKDGVVFDIPDDI